MSERRRALFLERQNYRRRRLTDWLRVLPLIGLGLWLVPLLWSTAPSGAVSTADAIVYLFGVWFVLVLVAGVSARALRNAEKASKDSSDPGDI